MINPNKEASSDVLERLKAASYERMRAELKCSVEAKMKDFDMTWDDVGRLLGIDADENQMWNQYAKQHIIEEGMTLEDLNEIAHIFSCELYIIFRPRNPWVAT